MNSDRGAEVTALAINVTIPEHLRWTDTRRGETFTLTTLNVRLLADGHLAVKAYGRPAGGGRGGYVPFAVPDDPALTALTADAATRGRPMGCPPRSPLIAEAILDAALPQRSPAPVSVIQVRIAAGAGLRIWPLFQVLRARLPRWAAQFAAGQGGGLTGLARILPAG